jgi:S-adenosylmethionine:tRNA ribosyltransferase-isomerase
MIEKTGLTVAAAPLGRSARLLNVAADGSLSDLPRAELAELFAAGDVVVANDAATLPASLPGIHLASGRPIEVRLAGWVSLGDPGGFVAVAFGAGDHRTRTEDRPLPPPLARGDRLQLGTDPAELRQAAVSRKARATAPLIAVVERILGHPRLVKLRMLGRRDAVLAGLARHGRPIQYAHVPQPLAMWDVWTSIAAQPVAFEPPSAGFAIDWRTLHAWQQRGVAFATLTHAAGISSTGDPALDARLPFDEPYRIPERTAAAIDAARSRGGRVVAVGTTVVRALEAAAAADGSVRPGAGIATGRIGPETPLRVIDAILTGVHQPGESHFELLRAFAGDGLLDRISAAFIAGDYRAHEFGDSMLLERQARLDRRRPGQLGGPEVHPLQPAILDAKA